MPAGAERRRRRRRARYGRVGGGREGGGGCRDLPRSPWPPRCGPDGKGRAVAVPERSVVAHPPWPPIGRRCILHACRVPASAGRAWWRRCGWASVLRGGRCSRRKKKGRRAAAERRDAAGKSGFPPGPPLPACLWDTAGTAQGKRESRVARLTTPLAPPTKCGSVPGRTSRIGRRLRCQSLHGMPCRPGPACQGTPRHAAIGAAAGTCAGKTFYLTV